MRTRRDGRGKRRRGRAGGGTGSREKGRLAGGYRRTTRRPCASAPSLPHAGATLLDMPLPGKNVTKRPRQPAFQRLERKFRKDGYPCPTAPVCPVRKRTPGSWG